MYASAAGEFEARCLEVIDGVARDRVPVVITKCGRVVAELVPAGARALFGYMAGSIVEWEAQP